MRATSRVFYGMTVFLLLVTIVYFIATVHIHDSGNIPGVEWTGGVALAITILLTLMLGGYFHFTERRIDVLPQDWEEAEVADNAGMYGFFAPSSIWPFAMAMSIALMGIAIAFLAYWLLALGAIMLVFFGIMLNLQYGVPKEKH